MILPPILSPKPLGGSAVQRVSQNLFPYLGFMAGPFFLGKVRFLFAILPIWGSILSMNPTTSIPQTSLADLARQTARQVIAWTASCAALSVALTILVGGL